MADKGKYSDKGTYLDVSASGDVGSPGSGTSIADANSFFYFPSGFAFTTSITSVQLTPDSRVFVYKNWIPFEFKTDAMHFRVVTAGSGSTVYAGIYNIDGTSLLMSGSGSGAAAADITVSLGAPVTLPAGFYMIAYGATTTGALPRVQSHSGSSVNIYNGLNNADAKGQVGYCANTISGGALPGTTGAITVSTSQTYPWMILSGSA